MNQSESAILPIPTLERSTIRVPSRMDEKFQSDQKHSLSREATSVAIGLSLERELQTKLVFWGGENSSWILG
jgi:hypothetical protein